MDVDAYVVARTAEWARLEELAARRRLSGPESDELVRLYQRAATSLSVVQSASPDPALVGRLSSLVARARSAVTGAHTPAWRDLARFFAVVFPTAVWRARWWVAGAAGASAAVAVAAGAWVAADPTVAATITPPEGVRQFRREFVDYYSEHPHGAFAFSVWTNNAWVAAQCLLTGISLLFPLWVLLQNALNVGVSGGLLAREGGLGTFFSYILPHGMLELTSIFVAAGAGLRLGWAWVAPGRRTRATALGVEGRAMAAVALGLVPVFAVAGTIEGFVTPSGLWSPVKLAIGALALGGFLAYVGVLGSRGARAGETGDLLADEGAAELPWAG
ncbi:putative membrane protein SpoIIM required for sporulation [Motilibacter peucedani]|uniref:Putative membrane protein SpoIIM required for sporulation n=1 Tax=Motilibacter peucedani TaxID=598650 RepID=A0A420XMQ3_9ACTN|nr:stage II sporulation protein M [Motilibacter peucedani]RKS72558.1 putative membrane protein SpoIIM required for sporulation [Motilibacter peucedani]